MFGGGEEYGFDIWVELVVYFIDRILKGVRFSDFFMEQLMVYWFLINLKIVKNIGLTILEFVFLCVDEVIY